jgi:hypothetical protein
MLVDARITLDVIGPEAIGDAAQPGGDSQAITASATRALSFPAILLRLAVCGRTATMFVAGTASVNGTAYYTLSHRPLRHDFNGEFRRIRVTVKGHPSGRC